MALNSQERDQQGGHFRLLDLPREVIRNICLQIYDPLDLSQQDRLSASSLVKSR